jgi:hypothetical protein
MADRVMGLGPGGKLAFDLTLQDYLEQSFDSRPAS